MEEPVNRLLPVLALLATLLLPSAALASSALPIAEAPTIQYGASETGGGHIGCEYWRLPAYAGDKVTLRWQDIEGEYNPTAYLFGPTVEDATIRTAAPLSSHGTEGGANLLTFTVPFTGLGVLQVMANTSCFEYDRIASYTFTATDAHAVSLAISAPLLAHPRSVVSVSATVGSVAGTPEGACLIQGYAAPLTGGRCTRRVRLGRSGRQTIRVSFVPAGGWQEATGSRHIRLAR
jgi:hypothetical protein